MKSVYLNIEQDIKALRDEIMGHQKKLKINEGKVVKDLRKYLRFYKVLVLILTKCITFDLGLEYKAYGLEVKAI